MEDLDVLYAQFEVLRQEMNELSLSHELSSPEMITKSVELDQIHNQINTKKSRLFEQSARRENADPTPLHYNINKGEF